MYNNIDLAIIVDIIAKNMQINCIYCKILLHKIFTLLLWDVKNTNKNLFGGINYEKIVN
jgi:hypothetical protein